MTDTYQPAEEKFEITRRCLELLKLHDFPVCIMTKSALVLRDIDLLREFSDIEVGITLTAPDDKVREKLEPGASPVGERLRTLHELREAGIDTWVFLGPLMPHITDIEALIDAVAEVEAKYVIVDRLRLKKGVWENVRRFIEEFYPQFLAEYVRIFQEGGEYYDEVLGKVQRLCEEKGLKCEVNWGGE